MIWATGRDRHSEDRAVAERSDTEVGRIYLVNHKGEQLFAGLPVRVADYSPPFALVEMLAAPGVVSRVAVTDAEFLPVS
jgi:hypothetical protein